MERYKNVYNKGVGATTHSLHAIGELPCCFTQMNKRTVKGFPLCLIDWRIANKDKGKRAQLAGPKSTVQRVSS